MKDQKKHPDDEQRNETQRKSKKPLQPDQPLGSITSSGDNVRRPELGPDTPPDEQTKGNP